MTVTELALLHLIGSTTATDASLLSTLRQAKNIMEGYKGYKFYFLHQVEDPSNIYIVGEWDSATQHVEEFVPTKENKAVLDELEGKAEVTWLMHLDVPQAELPFPAPSEKTKVWSITRHFIKDGEKEKFVRTFEENKHYAEDYVTEGKMEGGWRVDKDDGKEEFVLFGPWVDVEQHLGFAQTEGFNKFGQIRDHLAAGEIKHAKLLEV